MILRSLLALVITALLRLLPVALLSPWLVQAEDQAPRISSNRFAHPLNNVFYFDDSDILLALNPNDGAILRSTNAGETWDVVDGIGGRDQVSNLLPHPSDSDRAYVIGNQHVNWLTSDRGETWRQFERDIRPSLGRPALAFHGRDSKKVIFQGQTCDSIWDCKDKAYYTDDDFESLTPLTEGNRDCMWAVGTPEFGLGIETEVDNRIFCLMPGALSLWTTENRLVVSNDYFFTQEEAMLAGARSVRGIVSMGQVKQYLVVAAKAEGTDELALYVSRDGNQWGRAKFGDHKVFEEAYTVLESTNYSMQVDVKSKGDMGTMFTSNSDGVAFTKNIEHTNRGPLGFVDFEKITGIQGIVLVNTVDNWNDNGENLAPKQVISHISFDDGHTFHDLKLGSERLHLHSVTKRTNVGKVFSSPAPGIVMGVGNTGTALGEYATGNLFVSDDAGLSWKMALSGPQLYEFGDQGALIVAVKNDGETDRMQYSSNHGKDWVPVDLGIKLEPEILMTLPDSTSLKFLLLGVQGLERVVIAIDFEELHKRKCSDDDFERWTARKDENGEPSCLMGHKQFYRRRKADADCFVAEEFKDPQPQTERCKCIKQDFECDVGYLLDEDRSGCKPIKPLQPPSGACGSLKDTFQTPSGFRLIPGNDCEREGGMDLEKDVERPCSQTASPPTVGITHEQTLFDAPQVREWHYLERTDTSQGDDETVVLLTSDGKVYLTKDHGKRWEEILQDKRISQIYPHPYYNDAVYFLTQGKDVYYSLERGDNRQQLQAPVEPVRLDSDFPALQFHPKLKDSLIWTGVRSDGADGCGDSYYTTNRHDWTHLLRATRNCEFIPQAGGKSREKDRNLIFCEQHEKENPANALQLVSSSNWFEQSKSHFKDILHFATKSEFIIVASKTGEQQLLNLDASVDGETFASAKFPANFEVHYQQAYTVLDSSTHAIFVHVTVNDRPEQQYGTVLKSNSNGTFYTLAINNVNRDGAGYADFEKMQGLEGVAMVNVVDNVDEVQVEGAAKKLKSKITHNDGADWTLINPPTEDDEGKALGCSSKIADDSCSLHLHSYTERFDKSATFSSPSAVGLMLAVGNVGSHLEPKEADSTYIFITRDGGITWSAVRKGAFLWEYGDQGSIIMICERLKPTQVVHYTLDEGQTWQTYRFSDTDVEVVEITTTPSDNSRNFLLWAKPHDRDQVMTINVDFSGLPQRQRACVLQEMAPEDDDYYLWEPEHPLQDDRCLFGHVAQYHRKRPEKECFNGVGTEGVHHIARHCACTRQDFEWWVLLCSASCVSRRGNC